MPRYYFHIDGPDHHRDLGHDPNGTLFPADEPALDYARRIIRELKSAGGYDGAGLTMIVKSETDQTVFAIPFS